MILHVFTLLAGLVILVGGGVALVRGAVRLARGLGVSSLLIGLTVVAFGTSAPEFAVTLNAAANGSDSLALGNVIGSNVANVLLVLGLTSMVKPLVIPRKIVRIDAPGMMLATLAFAAFAYTGGALQSWQGATLLVGLATYLVVTYRQSRRGEPATIEGDSPLAPRHLELGAAGILVVGLAALAFGSDLIVRGAVGIAETAGLSERVVGTTIVAIGTSLPEITTCVVAAWRGQPAIALGNIVGSNVFNILFVGGTVAVIAAPVEFAPSALALDLPVMVGSASLAIVLLATSRGLNRIEGAVLLSLYAAYLALTIATH